MTAQASGGPPLLVSVETEKALLGALLLDNELLGFVDGIVRKEHFSDPFHASIFELISRQIREGRKATPITLAPALSTAEIARGVTPAKYLVDLVSDAPSLLDTPDYARIVRDLATAREIVALSGDMQRIAGSGMTVSEVLGRVWDNLDALRAGAEEKQEQIFSIGEASAETGVRLTDLRNGVAESVVRTGLQEYDRAIGGGLRAGRLYIEAGRPGAGKTVLAIANAVRVAKAGHGVAYFSLELDKPELSARALAAYLCRTERIPYRDIFTGENMDDRRHEAVIYASEKMAEWPLYFDTSSSLSIAQIEAKARMIKDKLARQGKSLAAIWIDYLQLIRRPERTRNTNDVLDISDIVIAAKRMGKRLGCAVIALSQLNRGVEGREDKRPVSSDLRQSGAIEETADCVMLLYRPAYYLAKTAAYKTGQDAALLEMEGIKHNMELILDKNRLGPTGVHHVYVDIGLNQIEDLAR